MRAEELVTPRADRASAREPSAYALTAAGHTTLERLTKTGEQRLADLLECWRPEEHEDLARMIATLAQEFFIDASALRKRTRGEAAIQVP